MRNLKIYRAPSRTELATPFDSLINDMMNELFPIGKTFGEDFFVKGSYPKVNVIDEESSVLIEAAVPGMKREDITLEIKENNLSISGKANQNSSTKDSSFIRREIKRSKFSRSFNLSKDLDVDGIKATCEDGVLSIRIPKLTSRPAKESRLIAID